MADEYDKGKDYEVGYGKPPKHTRFKKGQSGNPKGRPKKRAKDFQEMFEDALNEKQTIQMGNETRRMTRLEVIWHQAIALAMKGDPRALNTLIRLLERLGKLDEKKAEQRHGVLVVRETGSIEEYRKELEEQQRPYREAGYKANDKPDDET